MQRNSKFFLFFFTSATPPAVTPADAADDHTPRFKTPTAPLVSLPGRRPKPQCISAMEHLFPFRGAPGPNMLLHFSVLPHCMTVYFGKRRLAPETQSWQSTRCHFNEASWCRDNAAGHATLQDGQHRAAYLGKVGKEATAVCTISSPQRNEATCNLKSAEGCRRDSSSDYWTCRGAELPWWTVVLQFRVFPWLPPNACWE